MKIKNLQKLRMGLCALLVVLLLGLAGLTNAFAQDITVGVFNYCINEDGISVTLTGHVDGTDAAGQLVLPESVEYYGSTYAVTAIGNHAFRDCTGFTGNLVIPNTVRSIGELAFGGCTGLTGSLTLSENLVSIGELAFVSCDFTGTLTIPNSVISIGAVAFYGCGFSALSYNAVGIESLCHWIWNGFNEYSFVGDYSAFEGLSSVTTLSIGENVQKIPEWAFRGLNLTGNLMIPNSVSFIGNEAFSGCSGLTGTLNLPNGLTFISGHAFAGCTGLTGALTIPNAVTAIGECAFENTGFTTLNFNAVDCNEFNATWLSGVTSLTLLSIGDNVQRIPDGFLADFSGFTGDLTIPNSVTYIGSNAFSNCTGFSGTLTLGLSLTEIGNSAFFGACANFTSFVVRAIVPPAIGNNVFTSAPEDIPVSVPCGSLDAYQEASVWGDFTHLQEMDPCLWTITATTNSVGCATLSGAGTYVQGQTCTLSVVPNGDFEFVNWTENGQVVSSNAVYSFTVESDRTLVANFKLETLSDDFNDGVIDESLWTTRGSVFESDGLLTMQGNDGYYNSLTTPIMSIPENGQIVVDRRVKFQKSNETNYYWSCIEVYYPEISATTSIYYYEGKVILSAVFDGWEVSTEIGDVVYNTWLAEKFIIDINRKSMTYVCNNEYIATVDIPQLSYGYELSNQPYDVIFGCSSPWGARCDMDYVNINDDSSYYVAVKAVPSEGGTVSGGGPYQPGQTCTLTATPNGDYLFVNWTENGEVVSTEPSLSFAVTENRALMANFELPSCNLVFNISFNGDAGIWSGDYGHLEVSNDYGMAESLYAESFTTVTYTLRIVDGSHVTLQWSGYEPGQWGEGRTSYTVAFENGYPIFEGSSETGLNYEFDLVCDDANTPVPITAVPNVEGRGTVSGAGAFSIGETCTLTATPNSGHNFVRWMENGMEVSTEPTYSFTVYGPRTLVAAFTALAEEIIVFADSTVEALCVDLWDTDSDGYLSYAEAASVTSIYSYAFQDNDLITSFDELQYFTSLNAIPSSAFKNCGSLTSIVIPASVTSIGAQAFRNCGGLHGELTLPEGLLSVGNYAFASCDEITTINYNAVNCTVMGNAQQPVFYDCVSIERINIGATVESIPNYAFKRCSTVANLNVAAVTPPVIQASTFVAVPRSVPVTVPFGSGEAYRTTQYWEEFFNIIEGNGQASYVNYWYPNVNQFPSNMSAIGVIQIEGVEQASNALEIGAFCGNECRGSQMLTYYPQLDRYLVFLTIYGQKDDLITFRLYDHELSEESVLGCTAVVSFDPNAILGTYANPYVFNFTDIQNTFLNEGWTWYSSFVELDGIDGLQMMEESLGQNGVMIKSQSSGFVTCEEGLWMGSLNAVDNESMYLINVNAPSVISMEADYATPSQHPITLVPGWSWIGYPSATATSVNVAFANMNPVDNDMVKSQDGFAVYAQGMGWFGTLNTLVPGNGLMYNSNNSQTVSFVYQESARGDLLRKNITAEGNHYIPAISAYPYNMNMIAVVELEGAEVRNPNLELAAFAGYECCGSVKLQYVEALDRFMAFLTIAGRDAASLDLRLVDTETGVEYQCDQNFVFEVNDVVGSLKDPVVLRFNATTTQCETYLTQMVVYPNPVNANETVIFNMTLNKEVRIELVNTLGSVVDSETVSSFPFSMKAPKVPGIYMVKVSSNDDGCYCYKLIVR